MNRNAFLFILILSSLLKVESTNITLSTSASFAAIGDINNDGHKGFIISYEGNDHLEIYLNNNNTFPLYTTVNTGLGPSMIVLADFDSDGYLDIATPIINADNVNVAFNLRVNATFSTNNYPVGMNPMYVYAKDMNGDGKVDLIVSNVQSKSISILINNGVNFGSAQNIIVTATPTYLQSEDYDGDGKPDIFVLQPSLKSVAICIGNGDGSFKSPIEVNSICNTNPVGFVVRDVNNDGRKDIIAAGTDTLCVSIANNDRTISSDAFMTYSAGTATSSMDVGDLNGDGKLDVVITDIGDYNLSIFFGFGNGSFNERKTLNIDSNDVKKVYLNDINNDTFLDIVLLYVKNIVILWGDGKGNFSSGLESETTSMASVL
jgi:hypothetical protein